MTHVIYVTHNMLSKLVSLIDYVGESTSMMINELNINAEVDNALDKKKNLNEITLSKMNTHTQHVKNELMEIINEQIPFVTERKELLKKISTTKKSLAGSLETEEIFEKPNYCVDNKGILRENH
jgi:hypothetical protein